MSLDYWLWTNRVTKVDFAKHLGVRQQSVIAWCQGRTIPNKTQMDAIYRATGGQVLPNSFYSFSKEEFTISNGLFPLTDAPREHRSAA